MSEQTRIAPDGVVLEGRTVGLKRDAFSLGPDADHYLFRCESGFGCQPGLRGTAIFGVLINGPHAGTRFRIERYDVEFVVD